MSGLPTLLDLPFVLLPIRLETRFFTLADRSVADLPRDLLSTQVPPNWIPLLPVQIQNPVFPNIPGQILSRLRQTLDGFFEALVE